MDVVALVERARNGDVEAFTDLVRRHQSLALGSAVAIVRDADLARDVVQESPRVCGKCARRGSASGRAA
jgi:hypothetical protein